MSDDDGTKQLSLFELIEDEDFKTLGAHEENEYSVEVDKQTIKEAAAVDKEALTKEHANNFILWKFKFVDEPPENQTVLPSKFNTEANKTTLARAESFQLSYQKVQERTDAYNQRNRCDTNRC